LLPLGTTGGYFARTRPSRSYGIAVRLDQPAPEGMTISVDSPTLSTRPWPGAGPNGLIVVGADHDTGGDLVLQICADNLYICEHVVRPEDLPERVRVEWLASVGYPAAKPSFVPKARAWCI
jgi:hypothetical protein